jgi:hypothetical protein
MAKHSHFFKTISLSLAIMLILSSCTSQVVLAPPYSDKLRIGDGVKLVVKDGTIHSGRIVYVDRASVVIRTPKQKNSERPVEVAQFGTTIPWAEVVRVRVTGTLDSQQKLISNEEIRINVRTNNRRNYAINVGLLGMGISFLGGAYIQDRLSPLSSPTRSDHQKGRAVFWTTLIGGSVASLFLGYKFGQHYDHQLAIDRIDRLREKVRLATAVSDSLQRPTGVFPSATPK